MDVNVQTFRARFAEFALSLEPRATDALIDTLIAEAKSIHNRKPLATLWLAGHLMRLELDRLDGLELDGEAKSKHTGAMRADYVTMAETGPDAFFTSTTYGKTFRTLEKRLPRTGIGALIAT